LINKVYNKIKSTRGIIVAVIRFSEIEANSIRIVDNYIGNIPNAVDPIRTKNGSRCISSF